MTFKQGAWHGEATWARQALHAQLVPIGGNDCVLLQRVASCFDDLSSCPHIVKGLPGTKAVGTRDVTLLVGLLLCWAVIALLEIALVAAQSQTVPKVQGI